MYTQDLSDFWPRIISNLDLHAKTNFEPIKTAIKKRRLRWLGHVLRIALNRITRVALRWTPQGKRKQGRLKATWQNKRERVEKEIKEIGLTCGEASCSVRSLEQEEEEWHHEIYIFQ